MIMGKRDIREDEFRRFSFTLSVYRGLVYCVYEHTR